MAIGTIAALGLASAGLGLAKGIGGAVAAKRSFSEEDERRRRELQNLRQGGDLGMTPEERARLEGELTSARGAALRQAEVEGATARQAAQASGAGRDLFLAEMAGAEAGQQARAEGAKIIAAQEAAARQAQQQELAALEQRKAAARAGVVSALTGGIVGGAEAGLGLAAEDALREQEFEREQGLLQYELEQGAVTGKKYDRAKSSRALR